MPRHDHTFDTVEVHSWEELLSALHSDELFPQWADQGSHYRSPFVFRGTDEVWDLKTSLERLGTPPDEIEEPALRAFGKYVPPGSIGVESEWQRLALAQHNGLPTRVLDWTSSPLVAAHFATSKSERFSEDGLIWCVDVVDIHKHPANLYEKLIEKKAFLYHTELLDELFGTLDDFDSWTTEDQMIFFEPPSIDARIQNQRGILSVMNGPAKSHHAYLAANADAVRRVVIKANAKAKIRDWLDQSNVTERVLFPGLPGLCDWLKRYYGPT